MTKLRTPCSKIFRSSECGYKGDQLQCDKTFLNCWKFDNHTKYGGEPRDAYGYGVSVPLGMIDTLLKDIKGARPLTEEQFLAASLKDKLLYLYHKSNTRG